MLVLTQAGVGFLVATILLRWAGLLLGWEARPIDTSWAPRAMEQAVAVGMSLGAAVFLAGMAIAPLHLGRPHLAFRGVLGWRHSWLSREAIAFGLMIPAVAVSLLFAVGPWLSGDILVSLGGISAILRGAAEGAVILTGLAGVYCSARIYQFCRRELWIGLRTGLKFGLTTVLLGAQGAALSLLIASTPLAKVAPAASFQAVSVLAASWLAMGMLWAGLQLAYEAWLVTRAAVGSADLARTAQLYARELHALAFARFALGAVGGVLLPAVSIAALFSAPAPVPPLVELAALALACSLLAEVAARGLFFAAAVPLRMPGGVR
jgi:DMSO reductase anchor subunit